jgi:hypothetical protein
MRPLAIHGTTMLAIFVLAAGGARAAGTPEERCQAGRSKAAAVYAACGQKAMAIRFGGGDLDKFQAAVSKCRVKYAAAWGKLAAKAMGSGSTCDASRFVDNGDGTVTDNLTTLQWEKKRNLDDTPVPGDQHDADNVATWSATGTGTAADGTAYTGYLATLNGGSCFAGQCDWRLPNVAELQTILSAPYPCTTCIDGIFGPTAAGGYWSSTTNAVLSDRAWVVGFNDGFVSGFDGKGDDGWVRAVRGGL